MQDNHCKNAERDISEEIESLLRYDTYDGSIYSGISDLTKNDLANHTSSDAAHSDYLDGDRIGKYVISTKLGSGSSSRVYLGINMETNQNCAIKIVPRKNVNPAVAKENQGKRDERIYREILISSLLNHPHIVRLIDFLYNEAHFFLVFEYANGSQLFDLVLDDGPLSESNARRIFRQILSGVDYIHKNSVVHRDLKIENVLIDENGNAKIIDFGLSNFYDNKRLLNTFCGSLYFAAPELLIGQKYCGPEVDVWSLGVILYVMLCGSVPFDDKDMNVLQSKIKSAALTFPNFVSEKAKKLISSMILIQPEGRLGLEQIMIDDWVTEDFQTGIESYVYPKYPLKTISKILINVLEPITCVQFPTLKKDLHRYSNICIRSNGTLEQMYWARKPAISLYYLLLENIGHTLMGDDKSPENAEEIALFSETHQISKDFLPEKIREFVLYLKKNSKDSVTNGDIIGDVFKSTRYTSDDTTETETTSEDVIILTDVRKSLIQGIFNGKQLCTINSGPEFREAVKRYLEKERIAFAENFKNFRCTVNCCGEVTAFKVSMFYNVIIRKFIMSCKFVRGDIDLYYAIRDSLTKNIRNIKRRINDA